MKFWVQLQPPEWKVGNASHFVNVERRLKMQVPYLRKLRESKVIEHGPYAILNAAAAQTAFIANTDSWEDLSHILHDDPMFYLQAPLIHYLGDWEKAMAKHAETIGGAEAAISLEEDIRTDLGLRLR